MIKIKKKRIAALAILISTLVLTFILKAILLSQPIDGLEGSFLNGCYRVEKILFKEDPSGIREDDLIIAVDDSEIEQYSPVFFKNEMVFSGADYAEVKHRYLVERDGQRWETEVVLRPLELGEYLGASWPQLTVAIVFLLIGLFTVWELPQLKSAWLFYLFCCSVPFVFWGSIITLPMSGSGWLRAIEMLNWASFSPLSSILLLHFTSEFSYLQSGRSSAKSFFKILYGCCLLVTASLLFMSGFFPEDMVSLLYDSLPAAVFRYVVLIFPVFAILRIMMVFITSLKSEEQLCQREMRRMVLMLVAVALVFITYQLGWVIWGRIILPYEMVTLTTVLIPLGISRTLFCLAGQQSAETRGEHG